MQLMAFYWQNSARASPAKQRLGLGKMPPKRKALMAELEAAPVEKKARRTLNRRHSEDAMERTLSEHFSNFSSRQLRVDLVEGQTLCEHLLRMKREARARKGKVSHKALEELGRKFGGPNLCAGGVVVKDRNDYLDERLEKVVAIAEDVNTSVKSRQPLIDYLRGP